MDKKFDVIIIGGGPNGLGAGAYLSKGGLKVLVLEKRLEMGGGVATEEVTMGGFFHNTHAIYMMMVDYAPAYKDLDLERLYGLKHYFPPLQFCMPFKNGSSLCIYNDPAKTSDSIGQFSKKDADAYSQLYTKFQGWMDDFLAPYTYVQPKPTLEIAIEMDKLQMGREMTALTEKTPKELVEEWFEDDRVRALMLNTICFWGLDPEDAGLGYLVPLYLNRTANYRICLGGSHMLTQSLIKVILENRGKLLTSQIIKRIIVEGGVSKGVELQDGTVFEAKAVISTLDLQQTFLQMVGEENLDNEFVETLKPWMWEHWSLFGLHLALDEAPNFTMAKDNLELNQALIYILGCESTDQFVEDQRRIKKGEVPNQIISCTFPTVFDPRQCRHPLRHTGIVHQMVPYQLTGGAEKWYSIKFKEEVASECLGILRQFAPNIDEDTIRSRYISTPIDCENKFRDMVKGSIKQGQYHALQMGYMRPNHYCSGHRSPIKGLYMGGSCTYPGGTVLLASGYLAAEVVAEDLGTGKWWPESEIVKRGREKGYPL